jgi:hypothetical protein
MGCVGIDTPLPDTEKRILYHISSITQQEVFMDNDSLTYVNASLDYVRKKIFEIEAELLPPQKEKQLKQELKHLKIIEVHLIGEVVKLKQLSLFQEDP